MIGKRAEDDVFNRLAQAAGPVEGQVVGQAFPGEAEAGDAVTGHQFGKNSEDRGVHVDVEVPVHVGQGDAGVKYLDYLGLDFPLELKEQSPVDEIAEPRFYRIVGEMPPSVHQFPNLFVGQDSFPLHQGQVQPHLQAGIGFGNFHRIVEGCASGHDGSAGQYAFAPGLFHGAVDAGGKAEVVGCNDQLFQCLSFLFREDLSICRTRRIPCVFSYTAGTACLP